MTVPRISKSEIYKLYELAAQMPDFDAQRASVHLGTGVVMHMLGQQWFEDYIMPGAKHKNILTLTNVIDADEAARQVRIVDLAEMLYNLQEVEGYVEWVRRLINGDVEATLAELDLGRMLFLHSVQFRFVFPVMKKGSDYDVEIIYPNGIVACADAKCKIEGNDFSAKTIDNSLEKARKQLPRNKPGIIFVKHPAKWAADNLAELHEATKAFFRTSKRIVSVKYYVQPFEQQGDVVLHRHGYIELTNPTTRFDPNQNWDLFPVGQLKDIMVPDHWQRILHFASQPKKLP
jgi:hypothetical protein